MSVCNSASISRRSASPGTHNLLPRLGDEVFLEVAPPIPPPPGPTGPRWFGLSNADAVQSAWDSGRRLRGWVAQTNDLNAVLAQHGNLLGKKTAISRGDRSWLFSVPHDGSLPADGVAPSAMDWGDRGSTAPTMPDPGARLVSFQIEHPDPDRVTELYRRLGVINAPHVVAGPEFRYRARIETHDGIKELL